MRTSLIVPSGGIFSGIEEVTISDIPLKTYLDLLVNRSQNHNKLGDIVLGYVTDREIVKKLPYVDKEFLLTNIYSNNFGNEATYKFNCPVCENAIVESFELPTYVVNYMDEEDVFRFTYNLNGKQIYLCLPVEKKEEYGVEDYLHSKSKNESFNNIEKDELKSYILSEIDMHVGIQRPMFMYCPHCGQELPMNRPCGSDLFMMKPDAAEVERKNIYRLINMFSYGAHQPIGGLLEMSYRFVMELWGDFASLKEEEQKAIENMRNKK